MDILIKYICIKQSTIWASVYIFSDSMIIWHLEPMRAQESVYILKGFMLVSYNYIPRKVSEIKVW